MKILITGASSGIGRSMAYYLNSLGHDLVLVARNVDKLNSIKNDLGDKVKVISLDLSNSANCYKLHDMVKDVDVFINNAGFGLFGEFKDIELDKELEMIDVNVRALHILTKLYLKDMMDKDSGKILNVASIAGFMPGPLLNTYYATKNYVLRFSQGLIEELRMSKSNVSVHVLCPGPVRTNFDNVAGVKFSLKGLNSDYVAKYAVDCMFRNKFIIVPGFFIKIIRILSYIVPDSLLVRFVYMSQSKKK